jgi:protein-S-isoprenylcysteine O-methyltransferase Ste14
VNNPEYAKKRFESREKEQAQKIVMSLLILCALIMLALSGFNYRYHWTTVPTPVVFIFSLIIIGGFIMLFFVMKKNIFTSRVIEIQEDQEVIDTGLYSIVRHPMYLAFSVIFFFSPVILGSLYSLIPAVCILILLTFRIRNEEKVLKNELKGYFEYIKKVKYRLIPFIW